MTDIATPTITLAELYENQDQNIDALVIYKNLFKENPTEELQTKIDELKDKIFKDNTQEYSEIIDKIFTDEEKRNFLILPHEQFKAYKESQTDLKNEETYPEELTEKKEEEIIPDSIEKPVLEEKAKEPVSENKEIPEIEEVETPVVDETTEPKEKTSSEDISGVDNILNIENSMEDDISLEIDEEISENLDKSSTEIEPDSKPKDILSIEEIIEKKKKAEQNEVVDTEEADQPQKTETELDAFIEPQDENQVLNLINKLSQIRPDIVERVLKEHVGPYKSLSEIKLSDLNYVVELLIVSENVKKERSS